MLTSLIVYVCARTYVKKANLMCLFKIGQSCYGYKKMDLKVRGQKSLKPSLLHTARLKRQAGQRASSTEKLKYNINLVKCHLSKFQKHLSQNTLFNIRKIMHDGSQLKIGNVCWWTLKQAEKDEFGNIVCSDHSKQIRYFSCINVYKLR